MVLTRFRLSLTLVSLGPLSGCGHLAEAILLSGGPEFGLVATETDEGVRLKATDYDRELTQDEDCSGDTDDTCRREYFRGFAFYRSETGPYGTFELLDLNSRDQFVDEGWEGGGRTAWRAAIIRNEQGEAPGIAAASRAAHLRTADAEADTGEAR